MEIFLILFIVYQGNVRVRQKKCTYAILIELFATL